MKSQREKESFQDWISFQAPAPRESGRGLKEAGETVERALISRTWCSQWRLNTCRVLPKQSCSEVRGAGGSVWISKFRTRCPRSFCGFRQSIITHCFGPRA